MSLLSSISKIALTPSVVIGNVIGKGLEKVGIVDTFTKQSSKTLSQTTAGKVLGTAIAATGIGLAAAVAPAGSVGAAAKSIIPKSTLGKVAAAGTGLVVVQSERLRENVITADPIQFTGDIAGIIDKPSASGFLDLAKNNPLLSAIVGGAAALSIGKYVIPATASVAQTQATRNLTQAVEKVGSIPSVDSQTSMQNLPYIAPASPAGDNTLQTDNTPIQPQATQSLTTKKRKSSRKTAKKEGVRQSVKINIMNYSGNRTTKKYLNVVPLYN